MLHFEASSPCDWRRWWLSRSVRKVPAYPSPWASSVHANADTFQTFFPRIQLTSHQSSRVCSFYFYIKNFLSLIIFTLQYERYLFLFITLGSRRWRLVLIDAMFDTASTSGVRVLCSNLNEHVRSSFLNCSPAVVKLTISEATLADLRPLEGR
jgi:hypothetical protein